MDNSAKATDIAPVQHVKKHILKRTGLLFGVLFLYTMIFKKIYEDDNRSSIIGDSSDWNIIIGNLVIVVLFIFFFFLMR